MSKFSNYNSSLKIFSREKYIKFYSSNSYYGYKYYCNLYIYIITFTIIFMSKMLRKKIIIKKYINYSLKFLFQGSLKILFYFCLIELIFIEMK